MEVALKLTKPIEEKYGSIAAFREVRTRKESGGTVIIL